MKHIFLNLKRFDVPNALGGVNRLAPIDVWGASIINQTDVHLSGFDPEQVEFAYFLPEAHIISASKARSKNSHIQLGSQGVFWEDVLPGQNFGAFTSYRPAAAVKSLGCNYTIIGHCEERRYLTNLMELTGTSEPEAVNNVLNREIKCAVNQGLKVLYCIGEEASQVNQWDQVLSEQLNQGLDSVDPKSIIIGYEPVWSIGPGKTPADKTYITKAARLIQNEIPGLEVVYGGGLKQDNASMLASIDEISGGLIALTRFSGEIGFYPDEFIEIVQLYLGSSEVL